MFLLLFPEKNTIDESVSKKEEDTAKKETEEKNAMDVDEDKIKAEETVEIPSLPIEPQTVEDCRMFIEKIRREEFGVGMKFGEQETRILDIHRAREGRSLARLSRELYTKDSHFVLELIQNADDNDYSDDLFTQGSEDKPTAVFIVQYENVTVLNNEKGFMNANVKALCDIGKSTKGIHRKGYIGKIFGFFPDYYFYSGDLFCFRLIMFWVTCLVIIVYICCFSFLLFSFVFLCMKCPKRTTSHWAKSPKKQSEGVCFC